MWPFSQPEFLINFTANFFANAASDLIFGIIVVFAIKWVLDSRNKAKLSITAKGAGSGKIFLAELQQWPPIENRPAYADFQLAIDNSGTIAAINWLILINLPNCKSRDGHTLIELSNPLSQELHNPGIEVHHVGGKEVLKLQYASPADTIHSGYRDFTSRNLSLRIHIYKGYEEVTWKFMSSWNRSRKQGNYKIYADHMKTKSGSMGLWIDTEKNELSLHFNNE